MKTGILLIIIIAISIVAIKFVPVVNDWARGNFPESVLTIIGEKPKSIFEKGSDVIRGELKKIQTKEN
jgi:hypothetical protein